MPRNFGLMSRPCAGAVDRPAGSTAPRDWRNIFLRLPADGGISASQREGRSLPESEPAGHRFGGLRHTRARLTSPAPFHTAAGSSQQLRSDSGARMRRLLSWPWQVPHGRYESPHSTGEQAEHGHDGYREHGDGAPIDPPRAEVLLLLHSRPLIDLAVYLSCLTIALAVVAATCLDAADLVSLPVFDLFDLG